MACSIKEKYILHIIFFGRRRNWKKSISTDIVDKDLPLVESEHFYNQFRICPAAADTIGELARASRSWDPVSLGGLKGMIWISSGCGVPRGKLGRSLNYCVLPSVE